MDKLIGTKLDGLYEIESLIGSGGMANVYKGKDLRNDRTVAVKVLKEEFMNDEELVRRFKNESKAISILDHPNIVKVYDVSVTDKLQYIVMEYIEGITLREYLDQRGGKLTWRETVHFAGEILSALQHAHENGVVHRDVKPQNIMLMTNGEMRMMDFGIARISRAENQMLTTGKTMGSVRYISPEQAKGDVTDAKSDIYSVGIMMYEMLSGRLPFEKGTAVEVAIQQISTAPPPLAELAPDTPEALIQITERAMAKDPEQRYPTAQAKLDDFQKFKEDPAIKFAYTYLPGESTEAMMDKAKKPETAAAQQTKKPAGQPGAKAAAKGKKQPKSMFLPILFGVTLAFCIGCGIMCLTILKNASNSLFQQNEDLVVEDFVGMSRDEVEQNPLAGRVKFIFEENYNTKVEPGIVYKQSPMAGRTVKEGQEIRLQVSLGTHYEEIPPLTSMVSADAEALLKEKGLYVMVLEKVDVNVAPGTVISTDPAEGTMVESGSTVKVYVSRAPVANTTDVPSLVGLTYEDAVHALASHKLSVGVQTHAFSDLQPGLVCGQGMEPGTEVKINTRVSIVISDGPAPTPEPTPAPTLEPEDPEGDEEGEGETEDGIIVENAGGLLAGAQNAVDKISGWLGGKG